MGRGWRRSERLDGPLLCSNITWPSPSIREKREATLANRGLDFADADEVFAGLKLQFADERMEYGEERITTVGFLSGRMVVVI